MLLHQLRTLLGAFHIHSKTTTKLLAIATGHILNEMVLSQGLSIESFSNTEGCKLSFMEITVHLWSFFV